MAKDVRINSVTGRKYRFGRKKKKQRGKPPLPHADFIRRLRKIDLNKLSYGQRCELWTVLESKMKLWADTREQDILSRKIEHIRRINDAEVESDYRMRERDLRNAEYRRISSQHPQGFLLGRTNISEYSPKSSRIRWATKRRKK